MRLTSVILLGLTLLATPFLASAQEARNTLKQRSVRLGRQVLQNAPSPRRINRFIQQGTVVGVLDGTIIAVQTNNRTIRGVRLLGVDAPQIVRPETGQHCFSLESRNALAATLLGRTVLLERPNNYRRDSNGNLVRFVRLGGMDVNAWMIWNGFAFAESDHTHERSALYEDLEDIAREEDRGLFSYRCDYDDSPRYQIRVLPN